MSSKGSYAATAAGTPVSAKDLFAAPNYTAWVREAIRSSSARSDSAILYGSSISEPTDELVRLVREAFSARVTSRYISVFSDGNRFVADAICARYGVKSEEVVTTTGVTGALAMTIKALVGPGDHVLIEQPGFDLLASVARESGARIGALTRPAPHFRIDLDKLAEQLSPRTKLVIITNLHNPSGTHLAPQEILDIARLAARVGAILFVDEVYADFMRPAVSAPAATLAPNIISANSLTKVFGLHALKCGWMIGAPELLGRIQNQSSEGDGGISKLSHAVAAHVLESAQIFDKRWREVLAFTGPTLRRHADAMVADGLIEGAVPEFGCMYFPRVVGVDDTTVLARVLWEGYGLMVAPGEYFGMPGHIRIGFGSGETELDDGLARLHRALKEIRS